MYCTSYGSKIAAVIFGLLAIAFFGEIFLWVAAAAPLLGPVPLGTFLWYLFAFGSGLLAALLPFGLSFALLVLPLVKRDGILSGGSALLALSSGLLLILGLYGAAAALIGKNMIELLPATMTHLNDWILVFAGIFVYALSLGELGLIRMRIRSYGSAAPLFIQKRGRLVSFFLLGIFLGNIGVGALYPAIPLLLVKSAASASVSFGVILLALHVVGRILPLVVFALLYAFGIDGVKWISAQSHRILKFNGWVSLVAGSVILVLGVFSHSWFASSRLYAFLTTCSMPKTLYPLAETATPLGVFGIPASFGAYALALLVLIPLWWNYLRERRRVFGTPAHEMQKLSHEIDKLEAARRHLEIIAHIPDGAHGAHIMRMESEIDALETKRRILEDAVRYGAKGGLRDAATQHYEEEGLRLRRNLALAYSILALLLTLYLL